MPIIPDKEKFLFKLLGKPSDTTENVEKCFTIRCAEICD